MPFIKLKAIAIFLSTFFFGPIYFSRGFSFKIEGEFWIFDALISINFLRDFFNKLRWINFFMSFINFFVSLNFTGISFKNELG